jgi:hypothetical protein
MNNIPLYNVGDFVKIKTIEELRETLGNPIAAKCHWVSGMNAAAGGIYMVTHVKCCRRSFDDFFVYNLEGAGKYVYSEDTFDTSWSLRRT